MKKLQKGLRREIFLFCRQARRKLHLISRSLHITPSHHRHNIFIHFFSALFKRGDTKSSWKYVCEAGKVFACCWREATTEQATWEREEKEEKSMNYCEYKNIFCTHTHTQSRFVSHKFKCRRTLLVFKSFSGMRKKYLNTF